MNRHTPVHTPVPRIDDETERRLLAIVENDDRLRLVCIYDQDQQLQVVAQCCDGVVTGWMLEKDVTEVEAIRILQGMRNVENLQDENIALFLFVRPDLTLLDSGQTKH